MTDDVTGHRIDALEASVRRLQDEAVSVRWLDERFGRINDRLADMADDLSEIRQTDRQRRLAVYTAVSIGVISLIAALIMVGLSIPSPPT